jgi:hypothetical protein
MESTWMMSGLRVERMTISKVPKSSKMFTDLSSINKEQKLKASHKDRTHLSN